MSAATYLVGDVFERLADLPDASVDCVITSPPYFRQREYLPIDHPEKAKEIGQETTPAEALESLLMVMDALWPKLTDNGTFWVNLGDKHSDSGGAGGDHGNGGLRDGQPRYGRVKSGHGWPLPQSVCWLPDLFGASLAYGRNLLSGQSHRQWVTRPAVTWCKPNPMPGSTGRKFKTATELIVFGGKHQEHYFDVDPVREPYAEHTLRYPRESDHYRNSGYQVSERGDGGRITAPVNEKGKVPVNWWVIDHEQYEGAHFAVMPTGLIVKPIVVGCPPDGTVLDPFAGSGTVLAVATGHGRDAIGIDLDSRNADLARERVGMLLTVDDPAAEGVA